ncbi:hypothetical protein JOM56_001733 [Amanita muscaria]
MPQAWSCTPRPILFVHDVAPRLANEEVGNAEKRAGNGEFQHPQERSKIVRLRKPFSDRRKQVYRTSLINPLIASHVVPCFAPGTERRVTGGFNEKFTIVAVLLSGCLIKCLVERCRTTVSGIFQPPGAFSAPLRILVLLHDCFHIRNDALGLVDIAHRGAWERKCRGCALFECGG